MPNNSKIHTILITFSILIVVVTIWIFVIVISQFVHPTESKLTSFGDFDDSMWLLKILEETSEKEENKIKTILMYPRIDEKRQETYLKVNIDLWIPDVLRFNVQNDTVQDIQVDAVEKHFEVLQNIYEIQIVTDLQKCKTFELKEYILNDSVIVWKVNENTIRFFSSISGIQETVTFGIDIVELIIVVDETALVWRSVYNRIMITNLTNNNTRDLLPFYTKPKAVEMFGDMLYLLSGDSLTMCNTVYGEYHVIKVLADVILSPTLVLKLLCNSTRSMLLELVDTETFVELSTNSNVDTDNIDDLYVFTYGHSVLICDGLRGTVQILGSGQKHYLPLKNLKVKHVVEIGPNDFRIFLSSPTAVYIITIISGAVVNVLTRSDLRQITDISSGFIVEKHKKDYLCTVLPSSIANLIAKVK